MIFKRVLIILFTVLVVPLFSFDLSVIVTDRDLDIPLEGAKIVNTDTGNEYFTDFNGFVSIPLLNGVSRVVIITSLIGYEERKQLVTDFSKGLNIALLMEGVLEGQELVVEAEAIGETDEEVGVSTVIEKEIIQSAAKMGIIEDVMNAVKILPGVSYSGGFGSGMSVRGGDPSGLTAVMDGFVTKYPNHWGGAFSIFNPNIVESIKFSPGIFSVKHGQATSALLEVNTVDPTDGLKYSGILSTSTMEGFYQTPLGGKDEFGLLTGFRLTNYDLALKAVELTGNTLGIEELTDTIAPISRAPYIYDFYLKALYEPSQTFKWHFNGFWGNDGVGIENVEFGDKTKEISHGFEMFYKNRDLFFNTGLKLLPTRNLLMSIVLGYEYWAYDVNGNMREEGYKEYSDEFLDNEEFASMIIPVGAVGYEVYTKTHMEQNNTKQSIQGRYDLDWSINDNYLLQVGFGTNLDITSTAQDSSIWAVVGNPPEYQNLSYKEGANDTKNLISFLYTNLNANLIPGLLKMELGVRADHAYFMGEDDFTLNTYPEIAPRVNFVISPSIENDIFKDNVFSIGSGIFNKNPFLNGGMDKDLGIDDFELVSEKTFMSVLGWETHLPDDIRFKVEGYYKYVYDRFYYNRVINSENIIEPIIHFDGYGHIGGGDFLIDKKVSRYIDGLFSYTYVYARYQEPKDDNVAGFASPHRDSPIRGQDYYPNFHRFNTLNLLVNIKPTGNFTFTTKLTFATGIPKEEDGETTMFAAFVKDREGEPQIAEMYSRTSYYSDVLRTNYSLPLDFKFSWHNYLKDSKYEWEIYFAVQDVLAPVLGKLQPSESTQTSKWNGDSEEASSSGFSFPIPSIGFRMSF